MPLTGGTRRFFVVRIDDKFCKILSGGIGTYMFSIKLDPMDPSVAQFETQPDAERAARALLSPEDFAKASFPMVMVQFDIVEPPYRPADMSEREMDREAYDSEQRYERENH